MGLDNVLVVDGGILVYVICGCLLFLGSACCRKKSIQESLLELVPCTTYCILLILQFRIAIHFCSWISFHMATSSMNVNI